ncbi:MAG: helix-turn-helix domain-containing protein, partial [Azoarcus sp.]|nr:helix-turn-helix domain-containing protein [Azoarcus sp.]
MNSHKNARLTLHGRILLIDRVLTEGLRPAEVAQAQGVSVRTVYKWLARYQSEGEAGLHNRSCRPHRCPHAIAGALRDRLIEHRRQRHT